MSVCLRSRTSVLFLLCLPAIPLFAISQSVVAQSVVAQSVLAQSEPVLLAPKPYAHVGSEPIGELSGIVKGRGRDNLFWVHNDSGDSARIFAITAEGKSILPTYSRFTSYGDEPEKGKEQWQGFPVLNANNVDWEDIAIDEHYLYVSDMGNNSNDRRDLGIYLVSEIDPTASTRSAVIQFLPVVYPEQTEFPPAKKYFDSESLFTDNGNLYLLTKHRGGGITGLDWEAGANLYRVDGRNTDKPNVLTKVDSNPNILAATGADVSPNGQQLAVISVDALWLFSKPTADDLWLSAPAQRYPIDKQAFRQLEAVTWIDDNTLLIGNEQRDLFKVSLAELVPPVNP
jgi:hypothetical protein